MASQVSSPWGKTKVMVPCSFEDVMSEQLASQLQDSEDQTSSHLNSNKALEPETETAAATAATTAEPSEADLQAILAAVSTDEDNSTNSDEVIARLMQLQFDREHNAMLDREAKKFNGSSKVTISFDNYKTRHPPQYEEDEEEDEDEDLEPLKTKWEEGRPNIGTKGYAGSGKNITTKHDKVICGRKNAERLLQFPPEFESGDGEGMDMQLPNKVFNKLKLYSMSETKRSSRQSEKKEHSTVEKVLDASTLKQLFKLVNAELLESVGGCFAEGKESAVLEAQGGRLACELFEKRNEVLRKVAVKVFKTSLLEFRTREKYVHGDHRFSSDDYKKQNPRKIIKIWAMKEVANLNRMQKFGVPCPSVVALKNNILVMNMIGMDKPAPKLHEANLSVADQQDAYEQTVEIMKVLHQKCALVHADLSSYNLLWHDGKVYVIDVSQAVDLTHPQALNFLLRDCTNVSLYFQKQGVYDVLSPEQLFNEVTGLDIQGEGAEFKAQVQRYDRERKECNIVLDQGYSRFGFDFFFDKAQQERKDAAVAAAASATTSSSSFHASKKSLTALVEKYVIPDDDDEDSGSEGDEAEAESH